MLQLTASVPQDGLFYAGQKFTCHLEFAHLPDDTGSDLGRLS